MPQRARSMRRRAPPRFRDSTLMRKLVITALVAAVLGVCAAPAFAATATVTGNISSGSLSIATSATPSFSVTLDGTDKTGTYTLPTTVTDATGSANGWNLTVTGTQFTTGGGSPNTLATNASTVSGVTSSCLTTCSTPTNAISYPVTVPTGAPVKYFNAAASTGAGQFTKTPAFNVAVPASTPVGTYTSTLPVAIVSGP